MSSKIDYTELTWVQDGLYIDSEDGTLIATIHSEDSIENEAHGKLIAASPKILKALKTCLRFVSIADIMAQDKKAAQEIIETLKSLEK